ncbi:PDZ and LIM domain protein 2 [Larimichthys crocea]|uniref:PDZ and LIM domain protein 2 n=2 Tax=Larimichthys crocea TaxID=215358 RepID=A0A0F8ABD3_LARCR|nr:PDZ and LIM domain protein 2 [Larimichthys crocea]KAE8292393.1 PDZ and LIM domain protein 2 [Larimichthys crocea]TMS03695.1 PDZ and LIM domain protein 2 [Larimichthys crocea]
MALTVNLIGPSPWGFRIYGGRDFKKAITVSKVNGGSKADQADLQPGDIILEINGENTGDMLNVEAQNKIKNSKTQLQLVVQRPEPPSPGQTNGITTPEQLTGRFQEAVIVSRDENQNYREYTISSPASLSPGPYSPDPPASPDGKRERLTPTTNKSVQLRPWSPEEKSVHRLSRPLSQEFSPSDYRNNSVSSRTPTPPACYSPHSPIDRDVPMSPRRSSTSSDFAMQRFDKESEVYKMIQENKESRTAPRQSNTFKMLQEVLEADEKEAALRFPGKLSPNVPKPMTSSVGGVKKTHTCEKCGTSIFTVAVRITDDHYRHSECYTCTDCGLNLKMRGHFWVGDVMYCEKHAKERHQGLSSNPHATVSPRH